MLGTCKLEKLVVGAPVMIDPVGQRRHGGWAADCCGRLPARFSSLGFPLYSPRHTHYTRIMEVISQAGRSRHTTRPASQPRLITSRKLNFETSIFCFFGAVDPSQFNTLTPISQKIEMLEMNLSLVWSVYCPPNISYFKSSLFERHSNILEKE